MVNDHKKSIHFHAQLPQDRGFYKALGGGEAGSQREADTTLSYEFTMSSTNLKHLEKPLCIPYPDSANGQPLNFWGLHI